MLILHEQNNKVVIKNVSELHRTLRSVNIEVTNRQDRKGLPRVYFTHGKSSYKILLHESTQGFNVSGSVDNILCHLLETMFFDPYTEIGSIVLRMANADLNMTVEEFFK